MEQERRTVHRQLDVLERRLQEQLAAPAVGRERWADLQGSVSGLLEEMTALARRVEGLDEKLRLRAGSCEELVRTRTRELEQQLHAQQQKSLFAASTAEESSKRHTARLRKLGQTVEEQARRLTAMEEARRSDCLPSAETMRLEARLRSLEGQQASLEDAFRGLAAAVEAHDGTAAFAAENASVCSRGTGRDAADDYDTALRALEHQFQSLSQRATQQFDEHGSALANLRVRTEGQEQRLVAAAERLESVLAPPLEALRLEVAQLRDRDRQEVEVRLEHLSRRLQAVSESSEEAANEVRERLEQVLLETQSLGHRPEAEHSSTVMRLAEASASQEHALRRLQAALEDVRGGGETLQEEELLAAFARLDAVEHRLECLETAGHEDELAQKADRTEVLRIDAAVQELSEPLRRLSQRTASSEAKLAAVERRVEQLQQHQDTGRRPETDSPASSGQMKALRTDLEAQQARLGAVEAYVARICDLEGQQAALEDELRGLAINMEEVRGLVMTATHGRLADGDDRESVSSTPTDFAAMVQQRSNQDRRVLALLDENLEALRSEAAQLRERDRKEIEGRLEQLGQRMQTAAALNDELRAQLRAPDRQREELRADVAELARRLEGLSSEMSSQSKELRPNVSELGRRVDSLERERAAHKDEVAKKADKSELQRIEVAVQELKSHGGDVREALRRASHSEEAVASFEKRLEEVRGDLRSTIDSHRSNGSELSEVRLADLSLKLSRSESAAAALERRVDQELQDQAEKVRETIRRAEEAAKAAETRFDELRHDHEELARELHSSGSPAGRSGGAGLLNRVATIEATNTSLQRKLEEALRGLEEARSGAAASRGRALGGELAERVTDVLQRIRVGEDKATQLQRQLEQAVRALEIRLEQLRTEHEGLAHSRAAEASLSDRLSEALKRIANGEEDLAALRRRVEELRLQEGGASPKHEAELGRTVADAVRRLTGNEEEFRGLRADFEVEKAYRKDLAAQVEQALARVEASEATTAAVREEVMCQAPDQSSNGISDLESRVKELRSQVESELRGLAEHQQDIRTIAARAPGAGQGTEDLRKELRSDFEALKKDLGTQVEEALARVEASEAATAAVREELMCQGSSPAAIGARDVATGQASEPSGAAVSDLELRVHELRSQVESELRGLADQQQEIRSLAQKVSKGSDSNESSENSSTAAADLEVRVKRLQTQVETELHGLANQQQEIRSFVEKVTGADRGEELYKGLRADFEAHRRDLAAQSSVATGGQVEDVLSRVEATGGSRTGRV